MDKKTQPLEQRRHEELRSLGILDTPAESVYDDITQLAIAICRVPMAFIGFADGSRQWLKSRIGLEKSEIPTEISFCRHTIDGAEPLIVEDASLDPRTADNPLVVSGPQLRFYVGVPLVTSNSVTVGTLCILDLKPRQLDDYQLHALKVLARQVVLQLESKKKNYELKTRIIEAYRLSEQITERELLLRRLYEITSSFQIQSEEKINLLLRLGTQSTGMATGMFATLSNDICTIRNIEGQASSLTPGLSMPVSQTLCMAVLDAKEPLYFRSLAEAGFVDHPNCKQFGIKSYLGVTVRSDDEIYGVLAFLSFDDRVQTMSEDTKKIVQLMAQWISLEIQKNRHLEEIENQQKTLVSSSKMAALGEMAGNIAHEINNPLAAISGRSQLLRDHLNEHTMTDEIVATSLDKIDATVTRMLKVVKGLRDFARNSDGEEFSQISLQKILEDTRELCADKFKGSGIELRLGEVPDVMIDCRVVQVTQVLINLLGNAVDAIQELPQKWVELSCVLSGDFVQFRVRDSGQGIPEEMRKKIMQPFFTTKGHGKGTGIGLSISMNIVTAHKGKLFIDVEDKNTCFVMELPRTQILLKKAQ